MFNKYDAYKDSGIQWIDEIPSEWSVLRAKNFFNFRKIINSKYQCDNVLSLTLRGVVNNSFDNPEGLIPKDYATYQIFNKNDLVFKLIDLENISTSRIGLVHEKGIMSPAYIRLECKETVIPKFAYYYFYNLYLQTVFNKLGAGVRSTLSPKDLLELPYLHLCKEQQIKIVDFLDQKNLEIDQAIAIKQQQIALLNERKQIVIQKAVTQGLNPNVAMKDSGVEWIGQIPEHWNIKPLKFYIAKKIDNRGRTPKFGDAGIPMLEVSNITDGDTYPTENFEKFVLPEVVQRYERDKVEVGDILISTVGATSGKVVIIKNKPEYFICQNVVGFRMSKEINKQFISYALTSLYFKTSLMLINKGNTIDNLKVSVFINNKVLVPSLGEQREIVEFIQYKLEEINVVINKYKDQIEKLKEYKTTLINDAVTGKIKVA